MRARVGQSSLWAIDDPTGDAKVAHTETLSTTEISAEERSVEDMGLSGIQRRSWMGLRTFNEN